MSEPVNVSTSFSYSAPYAGVPQLAGFWLTSPQGHGVIVSALGINGAQIAMLDKWGPNGPVC